MLRRIAGFRVSRNTRGMEILLNPSRHSDAKIIDLCRAIAAIVHGEVELLALSARYWLLIRYGDSGVIDHDLREAAGHEGGKALLPWYERDHEVLGIGETPSDAARNIIAGGRGARLRAHQVCGVDHRKHLVFRNLDSRRILWPEDLAPSRNGQTGTAPH
jgi:hypothetical protein